MDGVFSSDDGNLRRLGYSSVVGAKKKAEHCGRICAVSGRQNPVGRDESTSAEAVSIDGDGHLPIIFINTILLWTNNVHKHINLFEIQLNTKGIHEGRPLLRRRCARFSLCVVHRNLNPSKQSRDFILIIRWFEFYDLLTAHVNRFGRFGYDQVTGTLRKRITREQLRPGEQFRNLCPLNW